MAQRSQHAITKVYNRTDGRLSTVTSHHDGWKTNTLNTQHKPKLNIIKEDLYEDSRLLG
jgi:hypothetical protein